MKCHCEELLGRKSAHIQMAIYLQNDISTVGQPQNSKVQ